MSAFGGNIRFRGRNVSSGGGRLSGWGNCPSRKWQQRITRLEYIYKSLFTSCTIYIYTHLNISLCFSEKNKNLLYKNELFKKNKKLYIAYIFYNATAELTLKSNCFLLLQIYRVGHKSCPPSIQINQEKLQDPTKETDIYIGTCMKVWKKLRINSKSTKRLTNIIETKKNYCYISSTYCFV